MAEHPLKQPQQLPRPIGKHVPGDVNNPPPQRSESAPTGEVALPIILAEVKLLSVTFNRHHQIRIGEVDTRNRLTTVAGNNVLTLGHTQRMCLDEVQEPSFEATARNLQLELTLVQHACEPSGARSATPPEATQRLAQRALGYEHASASLVDCVVETPR